MKFISQQKLELDIPTTWLAKVEQVIGDFDLAELSAREFARLEKLSTAELDQILDKARKHIISENSSLWSELKDILSQQSNHKCWYCESLELRSDNPVDHFRPKNKVAEAKKHTGYWWLAFDWKNYRFSCTYCNSRRVFTDTDGGKQDHFPLFEPPKRAGLPGEESQEIVVLLDPCNCDDVRKITYNIEGSPIPVSSNSKSRDFERAQKSINLYHLDHSLTCRARKQIRIDIDFMVKEVNEFLKEGKTGKASNVKEKIINLIRTDSEKPFSTSARAYLRRHIGTRWVKELLENN
ncbi:hypothetical protein C0V70_04235 [Bacteriovorax stolpii]|uniref:Uncharacterized protein n=1 Tax=Bacteriovorax stolpii TaxID=960 RepID=A0A2K9NP85_BACTC|nr:hypothetical protein [Bacteriovorax stolpii]AUN97331.1 hypothetical protein C0V70_04235 [Bacteriovorax stolpii]TDP52503.1 uncharacterized protein (TIGR02646 family) [Bacteriovorax stolpii]